MVRRLKKEKVGKEDSGRISLRPPGRSGDSLPVNLILKWELKLERKKLFQGMISQPLSLYLEGEEMSNSQKEDKM